MKKEIIVGAIAISAMAMGADPVVTGEQQAPVNVTVQIIAQSGIMIVDPAVPGTRMTAVNFDHGMLYQGGDVTDITKQLEVRDSSGEVLTGKSVSWTLVKVGNAIDEGTTQNLPLIGSLSTSSPIASTLKIDGASTSKIDLTSAITGEGVTKKISTTQGLDTYHGLSAIHVKVE